MNREIKFRFVYKSKKNGEILFLYFTLEQLYTMSPDAIEIGDGFIPLFVLEEDYDLIAKDQYIGYQDGCSKDIYQNDIIDTKQCGIELVETLQEYDLIGYRACWEKGKIIGNIHENPELLTNTTTSEG